MGRVEPPALRPRRPRRGRHYAPELLDESLGLVRFRLGVGSDTVGRWLVWTRRMRTSHGCVGVQALQEGLVPDATRYGPQPAKEVHSRDAAGREPRQAVE